jgi:hypothetical protein
LVNAITRVENRIAKAHDASQYACENMIVIIRVRSSVTMAAVVAVSVAIIRMVLFNARSAAVLSLHLSSRAIVGKNAD